MTQAPPEDTHFTLQLRRFTDGTSEVQILYAGDQEQCKIIQRIIDLLNYDGTKTIDKSIIGVVKKSEFQEIIGAY